MGHPYLLFISFMTNLLHLSIYIFIVLHQFLAKVCLVVCLVHLIGIILIARNRVIELVNKLLIISIFLLHLKLSHWICLVLHLLIHILNHLLVWHQQILHSHWIALLWCVLMNWKRWSVSHLDHFILLLRNRRKKFCLWHSNVSFIEVLDT